MTLAYLHLCDYAFLTDNGKVGIIGIFDRIFSKSSPTTHNSMFVVGQVANIGSEEALTLVVRRGNQDIFKEQFVANLRAQVSALKTYNFLIGLHNLTFTDPGVYDVVIQSGDEEIGMTKLVLEKAMEGN